MSEIRISDIIIPKYHRIFNDKSVKHIILTSSINFDIIRNNMKSSGFISGLFV